VITTINEAANNVHKPTFLRLKYDAEHTIFSNLRNDFNIEFCDSIETQLLELLACRNPSLSKDEILSLNMIPEHLSLHGETLHTYGVWVYYPWKRQLVHILDEEEFIEVRTNRNKYKITQEEQDLLRTKKIGIIGLSVGRAVATTIALERIAGEIRLADFDDIELSNLNRINAPLAEMGKNKSVSAAQEIAELDPYIKVTCYVEGYTEDNADDFFCKDGKIDLLVEECDDIRVKIEARLKAREQRVPVIMETNDNCIIDVERYDLDLELEIFNGKLSGDEIKEAIRAESLMEKTAVLTKLFNFQKITDRMKDSIPEFGKTVLSWPQLGSEVIYGSGVTVALVRMMLLGQLKQIEREYFGIERHLKQRKIIK
jgi:hypothetical protein